MKKLLFILILLISTNAYASDVKYLIGYNFFHLDVNHPTLKYVNSNEDWRDPFNSTRSINLGVIKSFDKFNVTLQSNRLINQRTTRNLLTATNVTIKNSTKTFIDSLIIGYRVGRINPAFIISNVNIDKILTSDDYYFREKKSSIIFGLNFSYLLTKNISVNTTIIVPNREFYLENAVGFGVNFIF